MTIMITFLPIRINPNLKFSDLQHLKSYIAAVKIPPEHVVLRKFPRRTKYLLDVTDHLVEFI